MAEASLTRLSASNGGAHSDRELPHVSNRQYVYTLRDGTYDADYLLYSTYSRDVRRLGGDRGLRERREGNYELVERRERIVLLKKAAPNEDPTPTAP